LWWTFNLHNLTAEFAETVGTETQLAAQAALALKKHLLNSRISRQLLALDQKLYPGKNPDMLILSPKEQQDTLESLGISILEAGFNHLVQNQPSDLPLESQQAMLFKPANSEGKLQALTHFIRYNLAIKAREEFELWVDQKKEAGLYTNGLDFLFQLTSYMTHHIRSHEGLLEIQRRQNTPASTGTIKDSAMENGSYTFLLSILEAPLRHYDKEHRLIVAGAGHSVALDTLYTLRISAQRTLQTLLERNDRIFRMLYPTSEKSR